MKNTVEISSSKLINDDCLHYIATLPDNSVDLIVTDPPYFKVKPFGWDNQWKGDASYLSWLDRCLKEFWRVLKPTGSIYLFCGSRLASDTELLMRERFRVLNHIIWAKPGGQWKGCHKENLRAYFPSTERVIFAEHYPGPFRPKDDTEAFKGHTLKQNALQPLISYFRDAQKALGVTNEEIGLATGKKNMPRHWFGTSQWSLPNEQDYIKIQALFASKAGGASNNLGENYQSLKTEYRVLLEKYKAFRRCFSVSVQVPYTDVWTYKPVQFYPGKHPCEKPASMMRDIINASSKPGDVLADFFMGSGSLVKQAIILGREAIGVEIETDRFNQTVNEIRHIAKI